MNKSKDSEILIIHDFVGELLYTVLTPSALQCVVNVSIPPNQAFSKLLSIESTMNGLPLVVVVVIVVVVVVDVVVVVLLVVFAVVAEI